MLRSRFRLEFVVASPGRHFRCEQSGETFWPRRNGIFRQRSLNWEEINVRKALTTLSVCILEDTHNFLYCFTKHRRTGMPCACTTSRDSVTEIFCFWLFLWISFPPSTIIYHLDRFKFFRKFAEIFASQGATPVSSTLAANFSTLAIIVDTSGNFATGVNNNGCKFSTGVNDACGKLPPVSTTPSANLPPV